MNKKLIVLTVATLIATSALITNTIYLVRTGISLQMGMEAGEALCEGTTTKKTIAKRLNDLGDSVSREEFFKGYNDVVCAEQKEKLKEIESQL